MSTDNILTRFAYFIFALISYVIYLLSAVVFVLRLLDITIFPGAIIFEFQLGLIGSICLDIALVAMFGIPHSVMARTGFKKYCRKIIPFPIERSFYVFIASITLILLSYLWQPIYFEILNIKTSLGIYAANSIFSAGLLLAIVSSFLIDHFGIFGLRQPWNFLMKTESREVEFGTPSLYKLVRHPMMLGMILILWSTPLMNVGHFILSVGMTIYIILGTLFEERDLGRIFGEKYRQYKREVPMFLPSLHVNNGTQKIKSEKQL